MRRGSPAIAPRDPPSDGWLLTFHIGNGALKQLWPQRLGRTVPLTNRLDWSAEQVVAG
jgi:hypothetical protein